MALGEINCARCGWQNEPTARMCGGCGAPLRTPEPGAVSAYAQHGGPFAAEGVGGSALYSPDAPTTLTPTPPDMPAMGMMSPPYAAGAVGGWPGVATPVAAREQPRPDRGRRILITTGVALATLLIGLVAAWALIIQPALHNAADAQLRNALASAVSNVPGHAPAGHYFIKQDDMNSTLQQLLPADAPIKNLQARFSDGAIVFTYSFLGGTGSVTTEPYASGGDLRVQGTRVDGLLSLVESGDQLENVFNDALSKVPEQGKINSVSVTGDRIEVTVVG